VELAIVILVPVALMLMGAGLVKIGYWPRRVGQTPYCAGCGYTLTGNESGTCPECGRPFTSETVVRGKRYRRRGLAAIGGFIFVLGLLIGGGMWLFDIPWYHYVPAAFIVNDVGSADPVVAKKAWDELAFRRGGGKLSEGIEARLTELSLAEQVKATPGALLQPMLQFLGQRFLDGKLSAQQADQLFMGAINSQLKIRPIVAAGEEIPFQVVFDGRGPQIGWSHRITGKQVVAGGETTQMGGSMSGGGFVAGSSGSWIRAKPVGTVKISVTYLLEIYEGSPPKNGWTKPVWSKEIQLSGTAQVVDLPAESLVKMANRPELVDEIRRTVVVERVERQANDEIQVQVDLRKPPVNVAFDVFVRVGGKEVLVGSVAGEKGKQMGTFISHKASEIQDAKVEVILRSNSKVARRTVDLVEAWKGEIVIKDVAVIDRRKK
jgi:hypothetical protein